MTSLIRLSLIIPCYNEESGLPSLIDVCKKIVNNNNNIEIILVDNGSTDNTKKIIKDLVIEKLNLKIIRVEINKGYGFGILAGLKEAKGEIIGWTHADLQTDPSDALLGLNFFEKHGDNIFVKGRRYGRPIQDTCFTICMSAFETLLFSKFMWDINAQPTMFSRKFLEKLKNPPNDFSLDLFAYYTAKKYKIKTYRFFVKFNQRTFGSSHWNINWKSKFKFIFRTFRYSLKLRMESLFWK